MRGQLVVASIRSRGLRVPVVLRGWDQLTHPTAYHPITPHPIAPQSEASTVSMPRERGRRRSSGRRFRTAHAELSFSMRHMKRRLNSSAPIFLAAIMQHLTAKVLGLAGNKGQNSGQKHITPELVGTAVHHNALLNGSFGMTTISLLAPAWHQLLNPGSWVPGPGCPGPGRASP
nr:histone H2A-Bbd type 2/3-like [Bubalus bubalis]